MRTGRGDSGRFQSPRDIAGGNAEGARKLNPLIALFRYLGDGSEKILLRIFADGLELKPDGD